MKRVFFVMAALAMSFSVPQLSRAGESRLPSRFSSPADALTVHKVPFEDPTTTDVLFGVCEPGPTTLCLADGRFAVEVDWQSFSGERGAGRTGPASSQSSGLFWFFDANNWDLLVKVLDGCRFNEHFWVFSTSTSNIEYTLRVRDTVTGTEKIYFNPPGHSAPALIDTSALAACSPDASASTSFVRLDSLADTRPAFPPRRKEETETESDPQGFCLSGPTQLCLNRSRFQAEVRWRDFAGHTGSGQMVPVGSDASGLFWFFDADNWEMLVQVRDGCAMNGRFWVVAAAATDVEYTLRVTDTQTGVVRQYFNPLGNAGLAVADTEAFATCPEEEPELLLFANPSVLPVLGSSQLTILARGQDGHTLGAGERIRLLADLGSIEPELVVTDVNGEARATFTAGDLAGQGSVTAVVEGGRPTSVALAVRDAPAAVFLVADRTTVPYGSDARIRLHVLVVNAQGLPFAGAPVVFDLDGVSGSFESGSDLVLTDALGRLEEVLVVPAEALIELGHSFVIRVTALGGAGHLEDEIVIDVR